MAKIEIWSKDVDEHKLELLNDPQHLYLIYSENTGRKEILRGGPEFGNVFGTDELKIVKQGYNKSEQADRSPTHDWNDGTHTGEVLVSGNETEIAEKWEKMWQKGQKINAQKYDYELLFQNSNTAVIQMAKAVGLDDEVKTFVKSNSLWTPADDAEFNHSKVDRLYDLYEALVDGIKVSKGSIEQFREVLQEAKMSPYMWLYLISKVLQCTMEELLKSRVKQLIEKLLGPVNPLKSVVVIGESDTGRNELFVDQMTEKLMDRATFVALIESGQYSGRAQ